VSLGRTRIVVIVRKPGGDGGCRHHGNRWLVAGIADQVNFAPGQAGSEVTVTFALSGTGSMQAGYLSVGSDWAGTGGDGR
jgi:hypothetical protein